MRPLVRLMYLACTAVWIFCCVQLFPLLSGGAGAWPQVLFWGAFMAVPPAFLVTAALTSRSSQHGAAVRVVAIAALGSVAALVVSVTLLAGLFGVAIAIYGRSPPQILWMFAYATAALLFAVLVLTVDVLRLPRS